MRLQIKVYHLYTLDNIHVGILLCIAHFIVEVCFLSFQVPPLTRSSQLANYWLSAAATLQPRPSFQQSPFVLSTQKIPETERKAIRCSLRFQQSRQASTRSFIASAEAQGVPRSTLKKMLALVHVCHMCKALVF